MGMVRHEEKRGGLLGESGVVRVRRHRSGPDGGLKLDLQGEGGSHVFLVSHVP